MIDYGYSEGYDDPDGLVVESDDIPEPVLSAISEIREMVDLSVSGIVDQELVDILITLLEAEEDSKFRKGTKKIRELIGSDETGRWKLQDRLLLADFNERIASIMNVDRLGEVVKVLERDVE